MSLRCEYGCRASLEGGECFCGTGMQIDPMNSQKCTGKILCIVRDFDVIEVRLNHENKKTHTHTHLAILVLFIKSIILKQSQVCTL